MRSYRAVYVLKPNLSEQEAQEQVNKVTSQIEKNEGEISGIRNFGIIKMAYQMQRNPRAHYFVVDFKLNSLKLKEIRALININSDFLREMTVLLDKHSKELDKLNLNHENNKNKEKKYELIVGESAFLNDLSQFVSKYGRIFPKHMISFSRKQMDMLRKLIKRARYVGLLPFKAESVIKI